MTAIPVTQNEPKADAALRRDAVPGRERRVRRVVLWVLVLNLVVAAIKAVYGAASGSLAVATDAVHSLLDAAGNIVALIALRIAAQPPDRGHPYGHRKFEIVAAAAVGVLIAAGVLHFGWEAGQALFSARESTPPTLWGMGIIFGTFLINIAVAILERRRGRQLKSSFLIADAAHTASDVAVTAAVLVSMLLFRLGLSWADPVAALVVLAVIARVAWQILAGNVAVLVDAAAIDPDRVVAIAMLTPGVNGCHRVRSRGTELAAQVDLHILLANDISLRDAHAIAHKVEAALKAEIPAVVDVTIHMEPEEDGYENL